MTSSQRNQSAAVLMALVAGWCIGFATSAASRSRPAMSMVVRAAKALLWAASAVDGWRSEPEDVVRDTIGDDGFVQIDHGRGW